MISLKQVFRRDSWLKHPVSIRSLNSDAIESERGRSYVSIKTISEGNACYRKNHSDDKRQPEPSDFILPLENIHNIQNFLHFAPPDNEPVFAPGNAGL